MLFNVILAGVGIELATLLFLQNQEQENIGIEQCAKYHGYGVHPYLAYQSANCGGEEEIPFKKFDEIAHQKGTKVVGIFGGSVASGLARGGKLETMLNERQDGRLKTKYRVVDFSFGGWKHPNQSIALLIYGDYIDIAVSIEGFNEHYRLRDGSNVDMTLAPSPYHRSRDSGMMERAYLWGNKTLFENKVLGRLGSIRLIKSIAREVLRRKHDRKGSLYYEAVKKEFGQVDWKHNRQRYKGFIDSFKAIAEAKGIKTLIVLQPTPLGRKNMDGNERRAVGELDYEDAYSRVRDVVAIEGGGLDLSRIFDASKDRIFGDPIHFIGHGTKDSRGDREMSGRIVKELERLGAI